MFYVLKRFFFEDLNEFMVIEMSLNIIVFSLRNNCWGFLCVWGSFVREEILFKV